MGQKTSENRIFSRFCALLYHLFAFIHFFERRKIMETKFNKGSMSANVAVLTERYFNNLAMSGQDLWGQ